MRQSHLPVESNRFIFCWFFLFSTLATNVCVAQSDSSLNIYKYLSPRCDTPLNISFKSKQIVLSMAYKKDKKIIDFCNFFMDTAHSLSEIREKMKKIKKSFFIKTIVNDTIVEDCKLYTGGLMTSFLRIRSLKGYIIGRSYILNINNLDYRYSENPTYFKMLLPLFKFELKRSEDCYTFSDTL